MTSQIRYFIGELRRRRVFRTTGLYLIGAWALIEVGSTTFEQIGLPAWTVTFLIWVAIIGFPVCVLLGWRYEIGPAGTESQVLWEVRWD